MVVEELKKQQGRALKDFRREVKKNPAAARMSAERRLMAAKILQPDGRLAKIYR